MSITNHYFVLLVVSLIFFYHIINEKYNIENLHKQLTNDKEKIETLQNKVNYLTKTINNLDYTENNYIQQHHHNKIPNIFSNITFKGFTAISSKLQNITKNLEKILFEKIEFDTINIYDSTTSIVTIKESGFLSYYIKHQCTSS